VTIKGTPYGTSFTRQRHDHHAIRALIQRSRALNAALSRELGINVKTVAKWRKRDRVDDVRMGPKEAHSTVLSIEEEAVIVAFRRHTLLPLDDYLYALQPTIPHLPRSSLRRSLQRHDISCLPDMTGDKPKKKWFKRYPIGYIHIHCPAVHVYMHERGHFRSAHRRRKAAPVRGNRPYVQIFYVELHQRSPSN